MSRLKHHVPTLVLKCQHGFWDSDMDKGPKQPQEPGHLTCLYSFSMFRGCIVFMSKYTGLWREAVFKVFCAICFFAASKITYKQFLTQKKQVSDPKCI